MRLKRRSRGWIARGQVAEGDVAVAVAVVGGPRGCSTLAIPVRRLAVQGSSEVGSDCLLGIGAEWFVADAWGRGGGGRRCVRHSIRDLSQRSAACFPTRCCSSG